MLTQPTQIRLQSNSNQFTRSADEQKKSSILIQLKQPNLFTKISILSNFLNLNRNQISKTQILTLTSIVQLFKNDPFKNNKRNQNLIRAEIIQILSQQGDRQNRCRLKDNKRLQTDKKHKELTNSAINMAISRLKEAELLIYDGGWYTIQPAFRNLENANNIVFKFN